jgi:hypothetical protein
MNCDQFRASFEEWLNSHQKTPLSTEATDHETSCRECATYAAAILDVDSFLRTQRQPVPVPDISHLCDQIIEAHQPRKVSIPWLGVFRPAALIAILATLVWGISLFLPPVPSAVLQLLLVFVATFLLLEKILTPAGRK